MANDDALHRCITQFMLDTCRYDTKLNECVLAACLTRSVVMAADNGEVLSSGSSVEFYIKPMLPYIDDIDIMTCLNSCLAMPAGHTPPTELPAHYQRTVTVYEIIDSHQPGYVYLMPSYLLTKSESGTYVLKNIRRSAGTPRILLKHDTEATAKVIADKISSVSDHLHCVVLNIHGPAVQTGTNWTATQVPPGYCTHDEFVADVEKRLQLLCVDYVLCMRCQLWPPQAADWPRRIRNHGVPDQTTIIEVVSNGCDLVGAVHPSCRQDEWMSEHQWRLSFSRAEVTLLNSWTPVQQIIYHMLRYVLKREVLSKSDDEGQDSAKLSNYHIKTLMLWECEEKPQSWWSAESSLIKLCSSLLHKLSEWVANKQCCHYFINDCNLLDHFPDASATIRYDLTRLADSSVLLFWFVENYIRECAQSYPRCPCVSALFEDVRNSADRLERALHAVGEWKLNMLSAELLSECINSENRILHRRSLHEHRSYAMWTQMCLMELQNFDPRLRDYFVAVTSLQVAYTVSIHSLTVSHLETLCTLFYPLNTAVDDNFSVAIDDTMDRRLESGELEILCRRNAFYLLHNEMLKSFLHLSSARGQESTYCVVQVVLAALCYMLGHYQSAIDHCQQVLSQCSREQYCSRWIGLEYLPLIDEYIPAVFGLIRLYRYVVNLDKKLQSQKSQSCRTWGREYVLHDKSTRGCRQADTGHERLFSSPKAAAEPYSLRSPAFTAHLLARYVYSKCSIVISAEDSQVKSYQQHLWQTRQPFLSDVLLFRLMKMQLDECTETAVRKDVTLSAGYASSARDTTRLVNTLKIAALDTLTKVREVVIRELHRELFPVVNEFNALFLYSMGFFKECIKMCRMFHGTIFQHFPVMHPEMLFLLDGELVSVFGLVQLLHPNWLFEPASYIQFAEYFHMRMPTLMLYLIACCQRNIRSDSVQDTMNLTIRAHNKMYPANEHFFFDRLILRMTYRLLTLYVKTRLC